MDLVVKESKGNTQLVVDNTNTSNLRDEDRYVRTREVGVMANQAHLSGGKSLQISCEPRVVPPSDEDEMQRLQREFANLNPKSPQNLVVQTDPKSPGNIVVQTEEKSPFQATQDQLDGKPRPVSHAMRATTRLDARCDPRAIPQTLTRACHPTDASSSSQPSDACFQQFPIVQPKQQSQVQVVPSTPTVEMSTAGYASSSSRGQMSVADQVRQLAESNIEPWKKDLIHKILRQYQKTKRCMPVAPDAEMENALSGQKKENQFRVQVIPEEKTEDMTITISDDCDTFHDIRPEAKPTLGNVQPQQELKTLNYQPSNGDVNEFYPNRVPSLQLDSDSFLRKYEFMKGYVLPGTPQSLNHLLRIYITQPTELAIGCHGILTTQNNKPTELGEYEEVTGTSPGHQFIKVAGQGSYGCVKMCRDNTTNVDFVKKEILKVGGVFMYEVKILSELNHQNIAGLYGFIIRDGTPEILMEYAGISLMEYTAVSTNPDDTSEEKIIEMTYQGLSALEYLDTKGIIHYDVKPENICILKSGDNFTLKITDFGSAKKVTEPPDFQGCTVEYLSPELGIQLVSSKYPVQGLFPFDTSDYVMSTKSDIFSLALTIMFVYRKGHVVISLFNNGKMSYNGLDAATTTKMRQTILVSLVKNPSLVKNVLIPDACCSEMKSILRDMVEEQPHNRPSASQLKDTMDDVLNRRRPPAEVPVFLSFGSFNEDRRVNLTRQLSSRSSVGLIPSYQGAVKNNVIYNRRRSRDQSSLPYGYTGHQKMDTNVEDVEVVSHLQGVVPNFHNFK